LASTTIFSFAGCIEAEQELTLHWSMACGTLSKPHIGCEASTYAQQAEVGDKCQSSLLNVVTY
jgi:hypothetical protein